MSIRKPASVLMFLTMQTLPKILLWTALVNVATLAPSLTSAQAPPTDLKYAHWAMFGDVSQRREALRDITFQRNAQMVAPLVYALRYRGGNRADRVVKALQKITGKSFGDDWFRWMQWLQRQPNYQTLPRFDVFLSNVLKSLDPKFGQFVYPGVKHSIGLHEIVWGGVAAETGIPPLDRPAMIDPKDATYLSKNEQVFGVSINGEARAYPYRFMDWHEMLNDEVGGTPISLAYCTLCGSGILYATHAEGLKPPITFGSSGLLYRSNKLMFDHKTHSLWNQFTGEPVVGELTDSGIKLNVLPLVSTTWAKWLAANPQTQVMHPTTGFDRDYAPGKPYGGYFSDPKLMFPAPITDRSLAQKARVFGLRMSGASKAWPLKTFRGGKVINDQIGVLKIVLVGHQKTQQVRAYRRADYEFSKSDSELTTLFAQKTKETNGSRWRVTEAALVGPNNEQLTRLPGHLAYWFAWQNYFGGDTLAN
ncbi:MAG: hypothetical protein ACI9ON_000715 [Limisphaerales bacterium]